jgi:hypothetical protein
MPHSEGRGGGWGITGVKKPLLIAEDITARRRDGTRALRQSGCRVRPDLGQPPGAGVVDCHGWTR